MLPWTIYLSMKCLVVSQHLISSSSNPPVTPFSSRRNSVFITEPKMSKLHQECWRLAILRSFYQQVDNRIYSHGLRTLVDDKSFVASCQQTCCKLIVKTRYPHVCCKLFQQVVPSLQMTSCNKPDFNRFVATWWMMKLASLLQLVDDCNKHLWCFDCAALVVKSWVK